MGEGPGFSPRRLGFASGRGTEHGTPQPVLAGWESADEYGQGGASCEDVRAGQAVGLSPRTAMKYIHAAHPHRSQSDPIVS